MLVDAILQCLGLKVGYPGIRFHIEFWVRERDSGGTFVRYKVIILVEGFQYLRYVLEVEVGVATHKVVYTLNFIPLARCLIGCLVSLGNPLLHPNMNQLILVVC